jgi:hypothetical protein
MSAEIAAAAQPLVAIIGTEASGKTVLITMLAKRFGQANETGLFLNPLDAATLKFVERNYHILSSGDWPPSAPMGQLFNLRWRLEKRGHDHWDCEIRLADSAGQDLRRLFGNDQQIESLPDQLQPLAHYCRSSDIVICLVDLGDFIGEKNQMTRVDNEAVIKSAIEYLISDVSRKRHLCVLFTQADQFAQERDKCGGWGNVAKKHLPYVHGAHLLNGRVSVGAIAAVADTKVVEVDGTPCRVPVPGFRSDGFESLMEWVSTKAHEVFAGRVAEIQRIEAQRQEQESQRLQQAAEERRQRAKQQTKKKIAWGGAIVAVVLLFFMTRPPDPRTYPLAVPAPTIIGIIDYGLFNDSYDVTNTSPHAIYDVDVDVDLRGNPRNARIYHFHWAKIPAGAQVSSLYFDVKNNGAQPPYQFKAANWFQATAGITYGRISNDFWLRNESSVPVNNIVVRP